MTVARASLVVSGQVALSFDDGGTRTAEAVGIADGRVVSAGTRREVLDAAAPGAHHLDARDSAVIPGLHDFHLHLAGMARARREVRLDDLRGPDLVEAVTAAAARLPGDSWLRGRGWSESAMDPPTLDALNAALSRRPALLYSHDAHSAWVSRAGLVAAGLRDDDPDPPGGRLERDAAGSLNGVLRERATDLAETAAGRLRGKDLEEALDEALWELAGWGVTGATDAGDTAAENGVGDYASLGDRGSLLLDAADRLDGRLRLAIGFPGDAVAAARALGLRTGSALTGRATLRAGWAKVYADGALGSRTAATFDHYTCGQAGDTGILRLEANEIASKLREARAAGIAVAIHAIGDRAASTVLDAAAEVGPGPASMPPNRMEHLQLLRPRDAGRLAALGITASVQPVHCAADRELMERCWSDRLPRAYPWRSLARAGARLAFGSDAPIESPNPWLGVFAAVHRRSPGDGMPDWQPQEALTVREALAGYTTGPADAGRHPDEGRLDVGCRADLAVLNVDLATMLAADDRLADVAAHVTLVAGREVHRA